MTHQHDSYDPLAYLNAIEVVGLAATATLCSHCHATATVLPMSGPGWGLDVTHERDCPTHEDNNPGSEVSPADFPEIAP